MEDGRRGRVGKERRKYRLMSFFGGGAPEVSSWFIVSCVNPSYLHFINVFLSLSSSLPLSFPSLLL